MGEVIVPYFSLHYIPLAIAITSGLNSNREITLGITPLQIGTKLMLRDASRESTKSAGSIESPLEKSKMPQIT